MTSRESDKATRYIEQLNLVRLNGAWSEVKELVRKVNKHAPSRQCLIVTATLETEITADALPRPSSAEGNQEDKFSTAVGKLEQVLETDSAHTEDAFAARVLQAHAQWAQGQWSSAAQTLAPEYWSHVSQQSGTSPALLYSVVKGKYILGSAQRKLGSHAQAEQTFESVIPVVDGARGAVMEYPEIHRWASRVLAELVTASMAGSEEHNLDSMNRTLVRLRTWSTIGRDAPREKSSSTSPSQIWRSYHTLLADILRSNLVYTGSETQPLAVSSNNIPHSTLSAQRSKQILELGTVARACEQALMMETDFPKASASNEVLETFADEVVHCWRIMIGHEWTDADIGEKGKVGVTRTVLDFLYRVAARTFHSTPILRHLVTVHATLSEFDLAVKALDSYIEIISKGKARAEKTGKHELGLDNDDIVLYTVSEAIRFLCLYGEIDQARKAYELGQKIASWLEQKRPRSSSNVSRDFDPASASERVEASQFSTSSALAAAYKGIGQSKATWARFVADTRERDDLQDEAIRNLGRSLHLSVQGGSDLETAYLLAYSQAERRTVDAIGTIKEAVDRHDRTPPTGAISSSSAEVTFEVERRKLPILHLLILVLSASQQWDVAVAVCDQTLEDIFEAARACDRSSGIYTDEEHDRRLGGLPHYLTKALEDAEKECLLQIKMSEMELLLLTENISYAASKRQELLKMYEQLFGNPRPKSAAPTAGTNAVSTLPKSRAGTVKSFRESIFGRPKSVRRSLDTTTFDPPPPLPDHPLLAKNAEKAAPTTQPDPPVLLKVTNEDGEQVEDEPKGKLGRMSLSIRRGRQRHSHDVSKLQQQEQDQPTKRSASDPPPATFLNGSTSPKARVAKSPNRSRVSSRGSEVVAVPADVQDEKQGLINGIPEKDESLEAPSPQLRVTEVDELSRRNPPPIFSRHQRQVHHISVLVQIWLFISGMYTKEDLYDDAKAAVDEAQNLVELLQTEQASIESSARAWNNRGWGLGRSISRLMADVWAERGRIQALMLSPHTAMSHHEKALGYCTDHSKTIIQMSSILLDIYEEKIPAEPLSSKDLMASIAPHVTTNIDSFTAPNPTISVPEADMETESRINLRPKKPTDPSPAELNRTAARDRAYQLLITVTKLGEAWDDAEAWFNLSRAHELMGQMDKAESCLWWVVELEDARPVRPWNVAGIMQ
ncbi:hypothetical protein B9Z65_6278 [Elsinoe australis]|uniref:Uncharacterized protein n=1 Tax=Elsinoe australis TaxID=40998 RepID=A0A2P8A867_9PEZI|nr:hypothetical protein B9Z65_6278 [Elsinoe australis]